MPFEHPMLLKFKRFLENDFYNYMFCSKLCRCVNMQFICFSFHLSSHYLFILS